MEDEDEEEEEEEDEGDIKEVELAHPEGGLPALVGAARVVRRRSFQAPLPQRPVPGSRRPREARCCPRRFKSARCAAVRVHFPGAQ